MTESVVTARDLTGTTNRGHSAADTSRALSSMILRRLFKSSAPDRKAHVPQVAESERYYAIGDVHGCYDLLCRMVDHVLVDAQSHRDERRPTVLFLGDYVDRGDQSRQVLERCAELHNSDVNCVFLRGNHEVAMTRFANGDDPEGAWIKMGGRQTLFSFGISLPANTESRAELDQAAKALKDRLTPLRPFLTGLKDMHVSGDVVFVHASVDQSTSLKKQSLHDLHWGRSGFLREEPDRDYRIVHGHYAKGEAVLSPYRVCVDTGAFYSGRLSAIRLDSSEQLITIDRRPSA